MYDSICIYIYYVFENIYICVCFYDMIGNGILLEYFAPLARGHSFLNIFDPGKF